MISQNTLHIANGLTISRVVLATILMLVAFTSSEVTLNYLIAFLIIGWSTDILDGRIARTSNQNNPSIWAKLDTEADFLLAISGYLHLRQLVVIPVAVDRFIFGLSFLALLQFYLSRRKVKKLILVSIPTIYLILIVHSIIEKQLMWIAIFTYLVWAILSDRDDFKAKVADFLSFDNPES